MTVFFISDLHLSANRPELTASFKCFLSHQVVPRATALYILGDLFEYWIGGDLTCPFTDDIVATIRKLTTEHKVKVYFMPGNRDFLLSEDFCKEMGMEYLPDPTVIDLNGKKVVLMHGDSLCTLDRGYQLFRKVARCELIQKLFLATPIWFRQAVANKLRTRSKKHTPAKNSRILDVNPEAICHTFSSYQTATIIHGHTHRPAIHSYVNAGKKFQRLVLGDWGHHNWVLRVDEKGMELISARDYECESAHLVVD